MATLLRGISVDINQLGVVLMGTVLGWFLMFAVRRYKVQWGAFASFMAIVFGVSLMSFLYARDLLAYYGIGVFLGFVANLVVRVAGTATGGKLGEGLLEISALERKGGSIPLDRVAAAEGASQGPLFARANVVGVAIGTKRSHEPDTPGRGHTGLLGPKRP